METPKPLGYLSMSSAIEFLTTIKTSITNPAFWLYSSFLDISVRYRTNRLGFIWIVLNNLLFVIVLGQLYHTIFKVPISEYSVHLYAGLIVWNFIKNSSTGCSSIIKSGKNILSSSVSITPFDLVMKRISSGGIVLLHNLIPWILIVQFTFTGSTSGWFILSIFGLLLLTLFVIVISILSMYLGVLLPDTNEVLSAMFRIGFLATPIIWMESKITEIDNTKSILRYYVEFNPFYHAIELIRGPALGKDISMSMLVVALLTLFTLIVVMLLYSKFKYKLELSL